MSSQNLCIGKMHLVYEGPDAYKYLEKENHHIYNGKVYKIDLDVNEIDECDFIYHKRQADRSIEFATSFYDGGTCLAEILDEIIEKENAE